MKNVIRTLLVALALGASGAYAQTTAYSDSGSKYDSHSRAGDSAVWGVGD
jgi:hypothetical protein